MTMCLLCRSLFLPDDVLQTLEVFVMERKQLLAELTAAAEQETAVNTLTPGLSCCMPELCCTAVVCVLTCAEVHTCMLSCLMSLA